MGEFSETKEKKTLQNSKIRKNVEKLEKLYQSKQNENGRRYPRWRIVATKIEAFSENSHELSRRKLKTWERESTIGSSTKECFTWLYENKKFFKKNPIKPINPFEQEEEEYEKND